MPKVEMRGRLDVEQFWPKGTSDADYTSMDRREARASQRGVWRWYTTELFLDETMHHVKAAVGDDVGPFVLPKLFRRLSVHEVIKGQVRGFKSWLRERRDRVRLGVIYSRDGEPLHAWPR